MSTASVIDPAAILRTLERRCAASAASLPDRVERRNEWSGVAFRVGEHRLLASLGEVVETLVCPPLTAVPNTCKWVRGIANVRGKLLPVIDLNAYLGMDPAANTRRTRVLVLDCRGVYSGLVVDEVLGLRHFPETACLEASDGVPASLSAYVTRGFELDGQFWGILSLSALAESPQFLQTAV
jgi:twitching motility protein PilI